MDDNSYATDHSQTTHTGRASGSGSGITLVLPSLKSIKASKGFRKGNRLTAQDVEGQEKKAPRPVKLKPLKEVLEKLIHQIKKKDDYAFFLTPVDASQTPGYAEVVTSPMDFGTMTDKVNRGKYRSLEDFASDIRLVAANAKTFNPSGSIYYTEAERIEAWALEHIAKAASTVIQYETDWKIEDDDISQLNIDDDDDNAATPMDIDDRPRSVSVAPHIQSNKRGPRGPYKKHHVPHTANTSETIDEEGRLPGSKDGLGAFPPRSDWSKMMVTLKLKGKRYRTKKERLRIERDGPPYLPDGSLDYHELEDPFSVLSVLAPDQLTRPLLTPIYIPPPQPPSSAQLRAHNGHSKSSTPPPQPQSQHVSSHFPSSVSVPLHYTPHHIPVEFPSKRRHWTIMRHALCRGKGKEREDLYETGEMPPCRVSREPHAVDFGSFALLAGELAEEMKRRGLSYEDTDEEKLHADLIRESLESKNTLQDAHIDSGQLSIGSNTGTGTKDSAYWTDQRAAEAEEYICDVVYGGWQGLAYVRSLAEFVTFEEEVASRSDDLAMPLAQWVEQNIVDDLTDGRHALLRQTALHLEHSGVSTSCSTSFLVSWTRNIDHSQVSTSLGLYPEASIALAVLLQISVHKIDMEVLIKEPQELYLSEEECAGKGLKEKQRVRGECVKPCFSADAMEVEEGGHTWMNIDVDDSKTGLNGVSQHHDMEGPEELKEVLDYVAKVILEFDQRIRTGSLKGERGINANGTTTEQGEDPSKMQQSETSSEDPLLRNLRLNLLALAKRAPLDSTANLPKDLVPEHIRHFVPTLETSS